MLKIPRTHSTLSITGIGGVRTSHTLGRVTVTLRSTHRNIQLVLDAHVLRQLTSILPSLTCDEKNWSQFNKLCLADAQFGQPRSIDIIIGADHYGLIIKPNLIKGAPDEPIAQLSIFGWLIHGPYLAPDSTARQTCHSAVTTDDHTLLDLLTKFWLLEETPTRSIINLTPEEEQCEQHFISTHSRDAQGRYIVRLPLKLPVSLLEHSKGRAQACLRGMLQRIKKNSNFGQLYQDFMKEYSQLGHMVQVPADQLTSIPSYYLPHHGVLKPDSLTT